MSMAKWFSTKSKENYSGEKKDFLASDAEIFGYPYVNIDK